MIAWNMTQKNRQRVEDTYIELTNRNTLLQSVYDLYILGTLKQTFFDFEKI